MDFLKEIEPYKEYVDLYLNKNCMPSYSVRLKMSKVYDDLRKDKRVQIYGTVDQEIRPIEQGCSPCIKRMMVDLRNWIKLETDLAQEKLTEFKGVPKKWGEFKTYCKEQGLNVNKKKRVDLEKELKDL
jgi:hypothetical protein